MLKESKFFTEKPANFASDEAFNAYFQASLTAAFTKEERQNYELAMHNKTDLRLFEEETLEKGFALGLAEGEAKGKAEIARNLKAMSMPIKQIVAATGLSVWRQY